MNRGHTEHLAYPRETREVLDQLEAGRTTVEWLAAQYVEMRAKAFDLSAELAVAKETIRRLERGRAHPSTDGADFGMGAG